VTQGQLHPDSTKIKPSIRHQLARQTLLCSAADAEDTVATGYQVIV